VQWYKRIHNCILTTLEPPQQLQARCFSLPLVFKASQVEAIEALSRPSKPRPRRLIGTQVKLAMYPDAVRANSSWPGWPSFAESVIYHKYRYYYQLSTLTVRRSASPGTSGPVFGPLASGRVLWRRNNNKRYNCHGIIPELPHRLRGAGNLGCRGELRRLDRSNKAEARYICSSASSCHGHPPPKLILHIDLYIHTRYRVLCCCN
jgi:hypothetical protein